MGANDKTNSRAEIHSTTHEGLQVGRGTGQQGDIIGILEIGHMGTIRQGRANAGAVDSDITVKPVKKQTKKIGAEGAPLFDTSLGRERRANPTPNLDSKAGGSIKGFHSSKHATMNSKAAHNLPQEGPMHKIMGRLKV